MDMKAVMLIVVFAVGILGSLFLTLYFFHKSSAQQFDEVLTKKKSKHSITKTQREYLFFWAAFMLLCFIILFFFEFLTGYFLYFAILVSSIYHLYIIYVRKQILIHGFAMKINKWGRMAMAYLNWLILFFTIFFGIFYLVSL